MFEKIKLKNLVDLRAGIGFPNKYQGNKNGNIPFYKVGDISREFQKCNFYINNADNYITAEILAELKGKLFDEGTIIFAKVGEALKLNRRIILTQKAMIDNNIFGIKSNNPRLNNKYLFYFLLQYDLGNICKTGAVPSVNQSDIYSISIPLPSTLEEQQEIVDVLDAASEIIRLRTACIESAQALIPALFQEMFGDVKNNTKNWKLCNLNDLVYIDRKNISVNELKTNAYRYIGLEHIEKDTGKILIDLENNFNVDLKSNKYYFTNEHVLYGKLRPYLNKVALPTCDGVCSTDIFPIMPRKNISNKYFIKYLMSSPYFVQITSLKTSGANLPRIGTKALELIKVICPDIEIQNQFAAKAQEIEAYIKTQQAELENAKTMFQSLLHHSFTGELTRHKFGGDANG